MMVWPVFSEIFLSIFCSGCLGLVISVSYSRTYSNFVYSRHFTHTCVITTLLCNVLAYIVTESLSENTALAFVLVGMLGVIRFRTIVRDSREFTYLFLAIVTGAAVGSGYINLSITMCLISTILLYVMNSIGFGNPNAAAFKLKLRLHLNQIEAVQAHLITFCSRVDLLSLKQDEDEQIVAVFEIYSSVGSTASTVLHQVRAFPTPFAQTSISKWDKIFPGKDDD